MFSNPKIMSQPAPVRPLIFAHRGDTTAAPENSFPAFRAALANGFAAVEFDVHLSRDGEMVVMHDPTLDRTALGEGPIEAHSWSELCAIALRDGGGAIPRLGDVLDLFRPHPVELIVEAKDRTDRSPYPELPSRLAAALASSGLGARCRITAFDWSVIEALRPLAPGLRLVGVLGPSNMDRYGAVRDAVPRLAALGASEIAFNWKLVDSDAVALARDAGLGIGAWTPNAAEEHRMLARLGVDWIITDRPDVARAALTKGAGR
jgi:glycerophosphoryl diester phosphodiesterase